jgi:hypothetical protein
MMPCWLIDFTAISGPGRSRWNPGGPGRFDALQVNVGWVQVQDRLRRYLHARTGLALAIRPLSALAAAEAGGLGPDRMVCSDAQAIYIPDEIDRFDFKTDNAELYRLLVRLEACYHEFGTHSTWKARALPGGGAYPPEAELPGQGDPISIVSSGFPDPVLAADLFVVFNEAHRFVSSNLPGLVRRFYPLLRRRSCVARCTVQRTAHGFAGREPAIQV